MVGSFDTRGCEPGEEILYIPDTFGNEQLPVEFAGKKCDMTKQVVWTKGGVACFYTDKELKNGHQIVREKGYQALFKQASSTPNAWYKDSDGTYWRLKEQGTGSPIKVGDTFVSEIAFCSHNIDGTENLGKFQSSSRTKFKVEKNSTAEHFHPNYGAILEAVSKFNHYFLKLKKDK